MSTSFKQCCFTRRGGQGLSAGWQTLACSPGISPQTQNAYSLLQNANVPNRLPLDRAGQPVNLLEIVGMEEYLCLSRIQYGLTDALGRQNNLFAHSYLFPLRDPQTVADPNTFLTVDNENFTASEEDARIIPQELVRLAPFDLAGAMSLCGLDQERYHLLIQCVFLQRFEKRPLYLVFEGTDLQLRALLYCIYASIPYAMRRTLSVASAPVENLRRNLIVVPAPNTANDLAFHVSTGANNVITRRGGRLLESLGFVDYFPLHWAEPQSGQYFQKLESTAAALGDPTASDHTLLKIAHHLLMGEDPQSLTEEDLNSRLYDALNNRFRSSAGLERYITLLLNQVNRRKLVLTPSVKELLDDCAAAAQDPALLEEAEEYSVQCLCRMTRDETGRLLSHLDQKRFQSYGERLLRSPQGAAILDAYYADILIPAATGWEQLAQLIRAAATLPVHHDSFARAQGAARELYVRELGGPRTPMEVFASYQQTLKLLLPAPELARREEGARDAYWEQFRLSRFTPTKAAEYNFFHSSANPVSVTVHALLNTLQRLSQTTSVPQALLILSDLAAAYPALRQQEDLLVSLFEEAASPALLESCPQLNAWYRLALELDAQNVKELYALDHVLASQRYDEFLEHYEQAREDFSGAGLVEPFQAASRIILQTARTLDNTYVLSLDIWLALGRTLLDNPYDLLDDQEHLAAILEQDAPFVCDDSHLMHQEPYLEAGAAYAKGGRPHSRQVKEWLNAARKARKKQGGSRGGGFFSHLFSSRRAQGGEAPAPESPSAGEEKAPKSAPRAGQGPSSAKGAPPQSSNLWDERSGGSDGPSWPY